jgi:hypothetical protein
MPDKLSMTACGAFGDIRFESPLLDDNVDDSTSWMWLYSLPSTTLWQLKWLRDCVALSLLYKPPLVARGAMR